MQGTPAILCSRTTKATINQYIWIATVCRRFSQYQDGHDVRQTFARF